MRGRTIILSVIALLLAGGTAILVRSQLERPPVTTTIVQRPPEHKSVLVAHAAIDRGQILKPADLAWQPWPDEGKTAEYIVEGDKPLAAFAGWVARESFVPGEPIIKARIVDPIDHRGFLAAVLHPGMRAVTVPVSMTSGIAGFVFPGDRVDVLVTHALPAGDAGGPQLEHKVAETILHDVRVIAIDQHLDVKPGEPKPPQTVTLEVTSKQSEIVALASNLGQLSLSLRSLEPSSDASAANRHPAADPDSFTMDSDVSRLIADDQVTIIRAGSRSTSAADSASAVRGPSDRGPAAAGGRP
jgi:pilus assembly protein CpaB